MAQERDCLGDAEYHVFGVAFLDGLAVEFGPNLQGLRVGEQGGGDDAGSVGRPAVETFTERPLTAAAFELPVSM